MLSRRGLIGKVVFKEERFLSDGNVDLEGFSQAFARTNT
jgi:hypothetical protein